MGFKTFNFHAALHVADDMINFGTARGFNVQSNEEHHKVGKTQALKTQKVPAKFDYQVASRMHDLTTTDLGMDEVAGGRPLFDYTQEYYASSEEEEEEDETATALGTRLAGSCIKLHRNAHGDGFSFKMHDAREGLKVHSFGPDLEAFLFSEYEKLDVEKLLINSRIITFY